RAAGLAGGGIRPVCPPMSRCPSGPPRSERGQSSGRRHGLPERNRILEELCKAQQFRVAVRPADQLDADRQTLAGEATWERDGGTAGERDHEGEEHPVDVGGQRFTGDLRWEALLDRERRYRNRRTDQQVGALEEARHTVK